MRKSELKLAWFYRRNRTEMRKSILDNCLQYAIRNLENHPEYLCFPHWSFVIRDNEILTVGVNRKHEPDKSLGFHNNADPLFRPKLHSEVDAIRKCNKRGLQDISIVNVRLNRSGETRVSLPCSNCRRILDVIGVKRVYFTTEKSWGRL